MSEGNEQSRVIVKLLISLYCFAQVVATGFIETKTIPKRYENLTQDRFHRGWIVLC
jgi:hypothetical protein